MACAHCPHHCPDGERLDSTKPMIYYGQLPVITHAGIDPERFQTVQPSLSPKELIESGRDADLSGW